MTPATAVVAVLAAVALVLLTAAGLGYDPGNPDAYAPQQLVACQSQVASLEASLYVAERERCEDLGVHPVAPPARKGGRR